MHALVLAIALALAATGKAQAARCGTALLFSERASKPKSPWPGLRLQAGLGLRARTLESEHFAFNYSLRGLNRVLLTEEDTLLARAADSLFAAHGALADRARDSAVYAELDRLGAPHPAFVQTQSRYFEEAWNYYIGVLGMEPPSNLNSSEQYIVRNPRSGRFPVDVADIGTVDAYFRGTETYAVTYPPGRLSVVMENDFLFNARLAPDGSVTGDSVSSLLNGKVLHNYAREWELGIKVTAFHEFYHAVHFTYVPNPLAYHSWYEISATGMEERMAPEVNDYLQYLPCVFNTHASASMLAGHAPGCGHNPDYGHGLFHYYLFRKLDDFFDVGIWERLRRNGDDLRDALDHGLSRYQKSLPEPYADYALQLLLSRGDLADPFPLFSDDAPLWPDLFLTHVDLEGSAPVSLDKGLPPLAFAALRVSGNGERSYWVRTEGEGMRCAAVLAGPDSTQVTWMAAPLFPLPRGSGALPRAYLLAANGSHRDSARIMLLESSPEAFAFPNPVSREEHGTLRFFLPLEKAAPAGVEILSESGRLLRRLDRGTGADPLLWDLRDEAGEAVAQGVYYYRLGGGAPLPVLVRP